MATKKFPHHPPHPERNCWGCDQYCAATSMLCGNGSERTQHPVELFGDGWAEWGAHKAAAFLADGTGPHPGAAAPGDWNAAKPG